MIEVREIELRLKRRWEIARGAAESKRNFFVRWEHDGVVGEGEGAFHRAYGESPESVRGQLEGAAGAIEESEAGPALRDDADLSGAARVAVEMALLDWHAKRAGVSLGEHLGVAPVDGPVVTSFSIGIDRPEAMAEKVAEASEFEVLKVKLGSPGGGDRELFAAIRSETEVPIRVDANGGWQSVDEAAGMIEWLSTQNVELVEQPLPMGRLEDTARLRELAMVPIVADEDARTASNIRELAEAYDGINIKLMKAGGIHEALRMAASARREGLKIMMGCMIESSLGIGAALQLASVADWIDLDGHLLIANDPYAGIGCEKGRLSLPGGSGIGVWPSRVLKNSAARRLP
jgi:L-alanine-DL-glutamate epimerase-like enolase superfamily enzyme